MKSLYSLLFLFTLGLTSAAQVPSHVPNDGLIAWYEMDGNLSDSSPHGHDGTATNLSSATDRYGIDGGCLSFSGSVVPNTNRTQIANDAFGELPISDAFEDGMTISIWALEAPTSDSEFLQRRNNNSIDFTLGRNDDGGVATHMGFEAFAGPGEAGLDSWHHYALTYDEETIKLYIDGVLSNSKSANQNVNAFANWVGLGKYTYYGGLTHFFFFNGLMDELGFWNRSLSSGEIEALFQSQENPSIEGCTDDEACNFDEASTLEDGSCEYGCRYCGPGATWDAEMQMCLPEMECDSLYNPDVDFDGFIGLTDLMAILSHYNNEWPPWECGDPLEYQGYDYETVQIGEQCWFAENLRAENYRNGDAIMQVNEASTWQSLSEGGRRIYGLGDMNCGVEGDTIGLCSQSSAEVLNFGGYLYNWYVVAEGSNVCPNGWHAPDNDAFDELLEHAENLSAGLSGLKSTEGWVEGSEGSNQTGFRAIGSGYGGNLGNFASDGHFTGFWSANASSGTNAHHLQIDERPNSAPTGGVFINGNNKKYALSIRCIKDTEQ